MEYGNMIYTNRVQVFGNKERDDVVLRFSQDFPAIDADNNVSTEQKALLSIVVTRKVASEMKDFLEDVLKAMDKDGEKSGTVDA